MRALSIKQPFAELILQGRKKIELRKWNTSFRGRFYIHSSKSPDRESMQLFVFDDLPCGFILGEATLTDVKIYNSREEHEKDKDLHLASAYWGNYGFILEEVERVDKMPAKGSLNFWDFKGSN